jgi:ABC-type transporter Mla MlaB component
MPVIKRERNGNKETITVSGDLTVSHAREMRALLLEAIQSAGEIAVILDHITEVDVTFPQLLCSAHRTAAAMQKRLSVNGVSEMPLSGLLQNQGFYRQVGCSEASGIECLWRSTEGR